MHTKFKSTDLSYIALFATLISVSGYISIPLPFSAVPVTAQTLAVMLTGGLLPAGHTAASITVFLAMGAVGLPVFSGGSAGLGIIIGRTGGYLLGFLVGAVLISLLKGKKSSFMRLVIVNATGGILVVYVFGVLWLNHITGIGLSKAIAVGAVPFIPGDMVKVFAAALLVSRLDRHIRLEGSQKSTM